MRRRSRPAVPVGGEDPGPMSVSQQVRHLALPEHAFVPIAGTVVSLAGASKPWLFASQARKQAYQLLQANATRARADGARLDQLAQTATATTDLKRLDAALSQASSVKQDLNGLYAASYAAAHTK